MEQTRVLSSDAFEGRGIGSPGEKKTVAYLTEQFKAMGLQPGNPDGSYIQKVPMVGISSKSQLQLGGCSADVKPRVQTKKFATAKGAAATIIVHETVPAAYRYIVVVTSNSREKFELRHKDGGKKEVPVRTWMRLEKAQEMFHSCV